MSISNAPYRQQLAEHFHRLSQISRRDLFAGADARYAPINLPIDSATMFAGYVGKRYAPGKGVLFLAINPGGGGDTYRQRTEEDELFYPLLNELEASTGRAISSAFEQINDAFVPIVTRWRIWRIFEPTLAAAGRVLDEIAYMNVVPYRTRNDREPPVAARRAAWRQIVMPTLRVLDPVAIITLGKKAGSVIDELNDSVVPHYCVPRTRGDSRVSDDAREVLAQIRVSFARANGGARKSAVVSESALPMSMRQNLTAEAFVTQEDDPKQHDVRPRGAEPIRKSEKSDPPAITKHYSPDCEAEEVFLGKYAPYYANGRDVRAVPASFRYAQVRLKVGPEQPRATDTVFIRIHEVLSDNPGITGTELIGRLHEIDWSDVKSEYTHGRSTVCGAWLADYVKGGFRETKKYFAVCGDDE